MCDRYATEASSQYASVGREAGVAEKKANAPKQALDWLIIHDSLPATSRGKADAPRSTTSSSVAGAAASGMRKETRSCSEKTKRMKKCAAGSDLVS